MTTVKEVKIKDVTILLNVQKDEAGDIKKEIRHSLDSPDHGELTNNIHYMYDDYKFEVISRSNALEIIVYYADLTIRLDKYVPNSNIETVVKNIIKMSNNVLGVGNICIDEYYLIDAK